MGQKYGIVQTVPVVLGGFKKNLRFTDPTRKDTSFGCVRLSPRPPLLHSQRDQSARIVAILETMPADGLLRVRIPAKTPPMIRSPSRRYNQILFKRLAQGGVAKGTGFEFLYTSRISCHPQPSTVRSQT